MDDPTSFSSLFSRTGNSLKRHWVSSAIALIAMIFVIAYLAGYRISTGFTFVRVGTLEITNLPADAQVYVDEGSRGSSSTGTMSFPLVPGTHAIIVSEDGVNPWETIATIATNRVTSIDPILIPVKPGIEPLSASDTAAAHAAFASEKLPTALSPLVLGCTSISITNNQIVASAATTTGCVPPSYLCTAGQCAPTIVFSPANPVRDVIAYPGRTDALLVAAGDTVYAIGIDPRTPQTFAELLSAPNISIAALPNGAAVAQNATGTYGLAL